MKRMLCLILSILMVFSLSACSLSEDISKYSGSQLSSSVSDYFDVDDSNDNTASSTLNDDSSSSESSISHPETTLPEKQSSSFSVKDIPAYSSAAYVSVNNNIPFFTSSEISIKSFESYSSLDSSGRCGVAFACLGKDLMPTGERGSIGQVKPSGWQTIKYDCVDGKYLYNRCHLIGWQLSGENANERNLITGTRYLNIEGMLPFENMTADYIKETNNHVMYRVTPVFEGSNKLATGVLMEAYSVEDDGDGICFNVFCYNVQPSITINYSDGTSSLSGTTTESAQISGTSTTDYSNYRFVLNTNSKKIHLPTCGSVSTMNESNKQGSNASPDELFSMGYEPCGNCNPCEKSTVQSSTPSENPKKNTTTVYVSNSGKIHSKSNCSGMKYYTEMSYDAAVAAGYDFCKKCY